MAIAFREFPIYIQVLIFLVIGVVLVVAAEFLPYSPLQQGRLELAQKKSEFDRLNQEVIALQVYRRREGEIRAEMEARAKQLEISKAIVPVEKEVDEFIRQVQGEATAANVEIRRLTAKGLVLRDYHVEMPFEIEVDGPYYAVMDFFGRLGRLARIINVGDVAFNGLGPGGKTPKYPIRPGTTVGGTFTATTFFTEGAEGPPSKQPAQPGKR